MDAQQVPIDGDKSNEEEVEAPSLKGAVDVAKAQQIKILWFQLATKAYSEFQAARVEETEKRIAESKLRGGSWDFKQDPDGNKALQVYNQTFAKDKPDFDVGFLVQPEFSALTVTTILFRHWRELVAVWENTENKQAVKALAELKRDGGDVTVDNMLLMQHHVNGRMVATGGFFQEVTKEELVGLLPGYFAALAYSLVNGLCADQYGKTGAAEMKVYARRQAQRHNWNLFLYNVFWIVTNTPSLRWPALFPVLEEEQKQPAGGGAAPVLPKPSEPQVNKPGRLYPNLSQSPSPQMDRAQRLYPILPSRNLVVSARWVKEHFDPTRENISSRARKPRLLECGFFSLVRIPGASGLGVAVVAKHPNWFGSLLCHAKTLLLRYDGVWTSSPKQALWYSCVLAIEEGGVSLVVPQYMRDEIVKCQKNLEVGHEALTKGGGFLVQHSDLPNCKIVVFGKIFFVDSDNRLQFLTVVLIAGGFWSAMDISSIAYTGEH
eukprot:g39717.t1